MEKLLFFIPSVLIAAYLLWLIRSPGKAEYYEKSKCEPIKEVVEKYEPKQKR
jgi:hypothetical protein